MMQVLMVNKFLVVIRSIFIIVITINQTMFVGASANKVSRHLRSMLRLPSSRQLYTKSNMRFSGAGGNSPRSAFVACIERTKFPPPKVTHHHRFSPTSSSEHHSQIIIHPYTSSAIPSVATEYSHSIITDELNDSQKEATLRPRYSITRVIAGPGAGKTKVLTCRIAHLLLDNNDRYDDGNRHNNREGILAVTFTKKAAMEMETRLTDLLSSVVSESESNSNDEIMSTSTGIATGDEPILEQGEYVQYGNADPNDANNVDDAHARRLLRQTTVGTFHSVCSKIMRKFGKELGELPSVRQCIGVVNSSGVQLTQEGIQTTQNIGDEEQFGGINGLSSSLTLDGSFNILDQSDQLRLLKDILKEHNIELSSPAASSRGKGNDIRPITVLNAISLLNTEEAISSTQNKDSEADKMSRKVRQIATQIRIPFQKAKYTQNSVDFDDLILLSRELLLQHSEIREVLHNRWRHILVDEFQDTSQVQLDLVRLLTTNSLFVVGDGDQSIYSWRGASPESMTSDFELAFQDRKNGWEGLLKQDICLTQYLERLCGSSASAPKDNTLEVTSVFLMENYRSTSNIVRAAQRIISTSESNNRDSAQDSMRRDMKPMRGNGPSPRVLACKDGKAEANFVVTTINSMVESGDLSPASTVAMIYRTNAQSRLLEEACVEHNLRYVVRGSSGTFYKRAEIQDCMSFMKIMYNARDRSAWARAVKAPSRGIGEASLQEFFSYCDAITANYQELQSYDSPPTPLDVLISLTPRGDGDTSEIGRLVPPNNFMSTRSLNRFIPFASTMRSLKEKAHVQSVSQFLMSVIDDLNLKSHFDTISKTREEYEDRIGNVMELVRAAQRYQDEGPCLVLSEEELESPLGDFLDDVALIADIAPDEVEDGNGRIVANLMTIHSSKGMEFDAVFLVGNEEGTFPTQKAISEGEGSVELSEERRLCYVAMTRAKTHLVLTWRREVSYFAGAAFKTKDADRSRFLRILVSKQGSGKKPSSSRSTALGQSSQGQTKNRKKDLISKTKRELLSEANAYLKTNSITGLRPKPKQRQVRKQPLSNDTNTATKRGFHTTATIEADPTTGLRPKQRSQLSSMKSDSTVTRGLHTAVNSDTDAPKKLWNDWEPSDEKKPINTTPKIRQRMNIKPSSQNTAAGTRRNGHRREIDLPRRRELSMPPPPNGVQNGIQRNKSRNDFAGELPPDGMDSTLFFPVGSAVKHKFHGKGIVQDPPKADYAEFAEKMLVRVKFLDGDGEWDLPMESVAHTFDN